MRYSLSIITHHYYRITTKSQYFSDRASHCFIPPLKVLLAKGDCSTERFGKLTASLVEV
jgi:predicted nuclease of predicted toxin-antitoxin system